MKSTKADRVRLAGLREQGADTALGLSARIVAFFLNMDGRGPTYD